MMGENTKGIAMLGILPMLFFAFTIFIPKYIIPDFPSYQKIALSAILLFYWLGRWKSKEQLQVNIIDLGLSVFILIQICRAFFIEYPSAIWASVNHWIIFLLLLLSLRNIPFDLKGDKWYLAVHFSCFFTLVQISVAFLGIYNTGSDGFNFFEYQTIANYTFGGVNYLAAILALHIPFLLSFNSTSRSKKTLSYLFLFCCLVFIFLLNSRGVSLTVVLMFFVWGIKQRENFSLLRYLVLPLVVIVSLVFISSQIGDKEAFLKTYNPISSLEQTDKDDRIELWKKSLKLFKEKPLLGHGLGSWKIEYLKYGLDDLNNSQNRFVYAGHTYNLFFELLAEAGIIGLLFFLLLVVFPFFISLRQKDDLTFQILFLISGFLMFYGFFYSSSIKHSPHLFLWAFALSRINLTWSFDLNRKLKFIGIVISCISMFYVLWSFYAAKQVSLMANTPKEESFAQAQKLERIYHPIFMNYKGTASFKEYVANAYWKADKRNESIRWLEMAVKDNPYRTINLFKLGLRYKKINNYEKSMFNFKKVLTLNSTITRTKIELSKVALQMKDWDSFGLYTLELENMAREELDRYYSDELVEGSNAIAKSYVNRQCLLLDEILKLREKEFQVRYIQ